MKQFLSVAITLLLCLSMLACDTHPVPPETSGMGETTGTIEPSGTSTPSGPDTQSSGWGNASSHDGVFSDEGYYYLSEHQCLCFLDVANGINVVLCSKVGCPHDNSQLDTNGEQLFCEAYIIGELQFFWEGKLYYTVEDDYGIFLYRRNADGTAEEQVMQLCAEYMNPDQSLTLASSCYFFNGIVYYQVNVSSIEFEGTHINYEIQNKLLMRLDLRTGKEELVNTTKTDARQTIHGLNANGLIYSVLLIDPEYFDLPLGDPKREEYYNDSSRQVIQLDIASGEEKVLMEKHFSETLGVQNVSGETLLYSIKEDDQQVLRSLNLTTGEDTLLLARDIVYINDCFCFTYEGEDEKLTLMDMQTSQLLPTAYQDSFMYPGDIGENGMILVRKVQAEGSSRSKRIHAYVSFADLADGLQEEDLVDFFIK